MYLWNYFIPMPNCKCLELGPEYSLIVKCLFSVYPVIILPWNAKGMVQKEKKFHLDMGHIFCKCYSMLCKQIISHFVSSPSEPRTRSGRIRLSLYTFSHIQLVLLTAAPSWVPPPTSHPRVPGWGYGPWKWLGKFYIYKFNAVSPDNLSSARLKITKGAVFQANFS